MDAQTINCPMCGASTSTDAPQCAFCGARLATVSCPKCFALMFIGSRHCPHCGAAAAEGLEVSAAEKRCPRCRSDLAAIKLDDTNLLECPQCFGLWLDASTFERICADREQQSAVMGAASFHSADHAVQPTRVSYVPCPDCRQLMNRVNFAHCSGVIIDLCKKHGIWFDRDELSRIIEFIHDGGLEAARQKEKAALEEERRRLQAEQMSLDQLRNSFGGSIDDSTKLKGIASTRGILKLLLG